MEGALDKLRADFGGRCVNVAEGFWGYRVMVVHDLDGDFPYPSGEEAPVPDET